VNDIDLLSIPAKDPVKFCLQAMDVLFSMEEMANGRYKVTRKRQGYDPKPPLDHKRVKLIDGNMYITIYNSLITVLFSYMQMQLLSASAEINSIKRPRKCGNKQTKNVLTFLQRSLKHRFSVCELLIVW
jgi:hypothetical protein